MAIRTFVCLSRNFTKRGDDFTFHTIKAKSADIAWQMVEESIATTSSQDWLMAPDDFYVLKKLLDNRVKIFRENTLNKTGYRTVTGVFSYLIPEVSSEVKMKTSQLVSEKGEKHG